LYIVRLFPSLEIGTLREEIFEGRYFRGFSVIYFRGLLRICKNKVGEMSTCGNSPQKFFPRKFLPYNLVIVVHPGLISYYFANYLVYVIEVLQQFCLQVYMLRTILYLSHIVLEKTIWVSDFTGKDYTG
jgi:hypothetical protein